MGWITRLLEGADAQRSTTRLAREDAKAERAAERVTGHQVDRQYWPEAGEVCTRPECADREAGG